MKRPILRYKRLLISSVVILLVCTVTSLVAFYRASENEKWVQHTHLVIYSLEDLLSEMKDAETGARGYLISRAPNTLEPYYNTRKQFDAKFAALKQLTRDNSAQQAALDTLRVNMQSQMRVLAGMIALADRGAQVPVEAVESGKRLMDQARNIIKVMEQREKQLLDQRNASWVRTWSVLPYLIAILTIVAVFIAVYFWRSLLFNYIERYKNLHQLRLQGDNINKRINIIQSVTKEVASGNYNVRLNAQERDTLGSLATDVNSMIDALDYSFNSLNDLMRKKDDFINITAHELRTPLTNTKMALQLIGRIKFQEEEMRKVHGFLEKANNQIKRLTEILRDLLDVSMINAGELKLNLGQFSLYVAIVNAIEVVQTPGKHRDIVIRGEEEVWVTADQGKIEQVISNLLSNAIKYSPQDSTIEIHLEQTASDAKVSILDQGPGIDPEMLPFVFDRYFRVERTSQNYAGMGLGLFISRSFVEQQGGKIGVDSILDHGSCFWFTLPLPVVKSGQVG